MTDQDTTNHVPTLSERKKSLLGHCSPENKKEKSNPILNNFSIKPIIQFFNRKLKRDGKKGSFKVERRKKLVTDKEYHSDTYVMESNYEHNKFDDSLSEEAVGQLEKKLYDSDKRSSLYSDFDDVNFNFVFNEDVFNEGRDEDINFGSDSDNEESLDYLEFLSDSQKDSDSELFQELLDEVGLDYLPVSKAPTVSQDEDSEAESDTLISSQEMGLFQKVIPDVTTSNSDRAQAVTFPHTEYEAKCTQEEQSESQAETRTKIQRKSSNETCLSRTEDSLDELQNEERLSTETRNDIKDMSTLVNAKDELTEELRDAKSVTNTNDTAVSIQMSEDDEVAKENIVENTGGTEVGDPASESCPAVAGLEEDRWDSQEADDEAGRGDGEDNTATIVSAPCENPPTPPSVDVNITGETDCSHGQTQVNHKSLSSYLQLTRKKNCDCKTGQSVHSLPFRRPLLPGRGCRKLRYNESAII